MVNRRHRWLQGLIGLGLLILFAAGMSLLLRRVLGQVQTGQTKATPVELAQVPTQDSPLPTPLPTDASEPPTPTIPPVSTLLPTPVVTPIPLAKPPIIPLTGQETKPYMIIARDGDILYAIGNDGANKRELVDVRAKIGVGLRTDTDVWGVPSPNDRQLALVLNNVANADQHNDVISPKGIYLFGLTKGTLNLMAKDADEPTWSPDGTRIAYQGSTAGLWIMDVKTGETHEVYAVDRAKEHFVSEISWAPDNKHLVFLDKVFRQSAVMILMDSDDAKSAKVLTTPDNYWPSIPKWSPDGTKIMFITWAKSTILSDRFFQSIWIMNSDGTNQTSFINMIDGLDVTTPAWSPHGQWIAFTGVPTFEAPEAYWDLWIVNMSGTELKRVTANAAKKVNVSSLRWSPDGTQLVYGIEHSEIWTVSLATGKQLNLPIKSNDFTIIP